MIDYYNKWLDDFTCSSLLEECKGWPLKTNKITFSGKTMDVPRQTCWFSSRETKYEYSGIVEKQYPYPDSVAHIKDKLEKLTGRNLEGCLVNYYKDENDSVGWHKDKEVLFAENPLIASVSIGSTRTFKMKNKELDSAFDISLKNGDLLLFSDSHVLNWDHSLPKTKYPKTPRLNLTFRVLK